MRDTEELILPDGRTLSWTGFGDPAGRPVIALHGAAGSHRQLRLAADHARVDRVRLIAVDRPGYGRSTFDPDQDLRSTGTDVLALADALGLDRFGLLGVSAGGPHALAAAWQAGERARAISVMSCAGPVRRPARAPGLQGVPRALFGLARVAPGAVRAIVSALMAFGRRRPEVLVDLRARAMAPVDREVLTRPAVRAMYEAEARHASPSAPAAFATDLALLARAWPFDAARVEAPVHLWHGELDGEAPIQQAAGLARTLPRATLHRTPAAAHLSYVDNLRPALLAAAGADRAAVRRIDPTEVA